MVIGYEGRLSHDLSKMAAYRKFCSCWLLRSLREVQALLNDFLSNNDTTCKKINKMSTFKDVRNVVGEEESIKYLFRFFCNNLYLGQWQLAKASLQQLFREKEATAVPISEVLKDVASYPFNRRCVLW